MLSRQTAFLYICISIYIYVKLFTVCLRLGHGHTDVAQVVFSRTRWQVETSLIKPPILQMNEQSAGSRDPKPPHKIWNTSSEMFLFQGRNENEAKMAKH